VPAAAEPATTEGLSERELEVLRLLATELSGPEIAGELFVSVNTLRTHTKHIFSKLDVNTRRAAVRRAADLGRGVVGTHARAGVRDGVLNHTVSGQSWQNLWFNGVLVGETGINAALCGSWGCPVLLVSGDEAVCREARELLGKDLVTVRVKMGLGRFSARQLPARRARERIEEGARQALQNPTAVAAYDPGRPCEIEVEFVSTDAFDSFSRKPGVEVVNERRLRSRADSWWPAWRQFFF